MKNFKELRSLFAKRKISKRIVIANAIDDVSIQTAIMARNELNCESILVGNQQIIEKKLSDLGENNSFRIVDTKAAEDAAAVAVSLIKKGDGEALLKGHIQTSLLFKAVLNKENGIRVSPVMSHVTILDIPKYHKLLGFTDGALMLSPTFEEKLIILKNAKSLFNTLGYSCPKIGIIEANEVVNPKIMSSIDAQNIKKLQKDGKLGECLVEGPISFDLATDIRAVEAKEYQSPVAGDADLLIGSQLAVINVMVKALQTFGEAKTAGVVLGASCPIVLVSRASTVEEKINSLMLALL